MMVQYNIYSTSHLWSIEKVLDGNMTLVAQYLSSAEVRKYIGDHIQPGDTVYWEVAA